MLVLLTPDFDGSPSSYQRLAELKGLVVRRMSLSPGASHRIEKKDEFQFSAYSRLVAEAERQTKPKLAAI